MISHTGGPLPIRKTYGLDCDCDNVQPRRGKNLPGGSLDSRAKKLHRADKEDYDFSIQWLTENAHSIFKNEHDQVTGLTLADEVSLCKAHSSTLYRAKKRHERELSQQQQALPSPADSNGNFDYLPHTLPSPIRRGSGGMNETTPPTTMLPGGLAAKVKELQCRSPSLQHSQQQQQLALYRPSSSCGYDDPTPGPLPDFSAMSASTSMKRKRTAHHHWRRSSSSPPPPQPPPLSSASTPLFTSNPALGYSSLTSPSTLHPSLHDHHHCPVSSIDPFTSQQLPPLQITTPQQKQQQQQQHSIYYQQQQQQRSHSHHPHRLPPSNSSSLFMAFQQQACISPSSSSYSCNHHQHDSPPANTRLLVETISLKTDRQQTIRPVMGLAKRPVIEDTHMDNPSPSPPSLPNIILSSNSSSTYPSSTSSTSSSSSSSFSNTPSSFYFIRNLAITDTFTFHQLLEEIEMDRPPAGKRIVISNTTNDTFYPLNEPIRSVLRDPPSSHVELCLGLCDKPSFAWSSLGNPST
ncbi:hypothetical protein [Absidia glauca]|uniref:Uncharacterized protein n=1 Tax=Absidia glauca TaxID=4829 RepID=A0A163ITQ8_ABSGL|nr:hypothetical protein [Absidia glauca]